MYYEIDEMSWTGVYETDDPNIALSSFEFEFKRLYDKHFPIQEQSAKKQKIKDLDDRWAPYFHKT